MAGGLLSAKEDRRNTDGEMDKPFLALTLLLLQKRRKAHG